MNSAIDVRAYSRAHARTSTDFIVCPTPWTDNYTALAIPRAL